MSLKTVRVARGHTQESLAEATGVSDNTISWGERGHITQATIEGLLQFAI
jgi:transcriptional regulator with XRE-family HTH domain